MDDVQHGADEDAIVEGRAEIGETQAESRLETPIP